MKVNIEREVNLDWLLSQLDNKSQVHPDGMGGYEVRVDKQLLRDAHDVIKQFIKMKPDFILEENGYRFVYKT